MLVIVSVLVPEDVSLSVELVVTELDPDPVDVLELVLEQVAIPVADAE